MDITEMWIKAKPLNDYPWYLRPFFWSQKRKYGNALNSSLVWARSPRIFLGLSALFGGIDRSSSPIPPSLRSLVIIRVSQLNSCEFCIDLNSYVMHERNVDWDKITSISKWEESELFDQKEKVSLEYAEAITITEREVDKDLIDRLKVYFSDDELVELTAVIAYQNMSTKFNNALGIESQGFCLTDS